MLRNDIIWPDSRWFKSRSEWEPVGFFSEALCNAKTFDIKLGFFSSSAINVLAYSFASFLYNGGKMRMIINDVLSEPDKNALLLGKSTSCMPFFNLEQLESLTQTLSKRDEHFFNCLAWLINKKRLEIKIIAPKSGNGIAHSKCGVFSDGLNQVGFNGSCNFSRMALIENIEDISAFCDWDSESDKYKIKIIGEDFDKTFLGDDETVNYISAENVITGISAQYPIKDICELLEDELSVIKEGMSNAQSPSIKNILNKAKQRVKSLIEEKKNRDIAPISVGTPCFPYPSGPREYQQLAFNNWKNNGQQGLFAMATGTGKTITSLNCLLEIYKKRGYYKALILVPTITLVNQWEEECRKFNFTRIIKVSSKNPKWHDDIRRLKFDELHASPDEKISFVIISTYTTFARNTAFDKLNKFSKNQVLLIADEMHNIGSPGMLKKLKDIVYLRRIGLSATPERQFDDKTNQRIAKFFGAELGYTYEYSMKEAIDKDVLCQYYYYPHIVQLTDDEMDRYIDYSIKISKYFNFATESFDKSDDVLMALLLARKRIIHKATNKLAEFQKIIEEKYRQQGNLKYTLVYVPEGTKPDSNDADIFDSSETIPDDMETNNLIDLYTDSVRRLDKRITVKKFTGETNDRDEILNSFSTGQLQVLTSMKCLDEGVDVPRSEMAIFCASTGNPRQFIQRRGRILRKHPDKKTAYLHDLVVIPKVCETCSSFRMEQSLLKNELKRVCDFAMLSKNPSFAQMELLDVMEFYGLNLFNNNHIQ